MSSRNKIFDHERKTIRVWWPDKPDPGNVGDIITPWILNKMFPKYKISRINSPYSPKTLLGVGSILTKSNENTVVWGSGAMWRNRVPSNLSEYIAVRGPISREILVDNNIKCPEVYGDPALLAPFFYNNRIGKSNKIGIFPHYVDYDNVRKMYKNTANVKIINPLTERVESVIDQITSCTSIVSSSLHGIILAHAYGIPASWVKFSDDLSGDGVKFDDYFISVKGKKYDYFDFSEYLTYGELQKLNFVSPDINFDAYKLIKPLMEKFYE